MRYLGLTLLSLSFSSLYPVRASQQQEMLYGVRSPYLFVLDPAAPHKLNSTWLESKGQVHAVWGLTYDGSQLLSLDLLAESKNLVRIQAENGFTSVIGPTGYLWIGRSLKWHSGHGKLYAIASILLGGNDLYWIDPTTGAATVIAPIQGSATIVTVFAIDPAGQAWAMSLSPNGPGLALFLLDLASGNLFFHGNIKGIASGIVDMDFNSQGQLWASVAGQGPANGLYTIDVATLVATHVLYDQIGFASIAFAPGCVSTMYCTGKPNSEGCIPRLDISGQVSVSQIGAIVTVTDVPTASTGFLTYGLNGRAATPMQGGGTLCVAPPLRHSPLGVARKHSHAWPPCFTWWTMDMSLYLSFQPPLPPGTIINCQWWGRDPGFSAPNNLSLSNGLEFTICP